MKVKDGQRKYQENLNTNPLQAKNCTLLGSWPNLPYGSLFMLLLPANVIALVRSVEQENVALSLLPPSVFALMERINPVSLNVALVLPIKFGVMISLSTWSNVNIVSDPLKHCKISITLEVYP